MTKRNAIALLGTLFLLGAGAALVYAFTTRESDAPTVRAAYASETYGIGFSYPASYLIDEREASASETSHYSIVLFEDTSYAREVLSGVATGGEAPPAIMVSIYPNPAGLTPEAWVRSSQESNFHLSPNGVLSETVVAGQTAVTYEYDGLYRGESTVFAHENQIIKVSADYMTVEDRTRADVPGILASFELRESVGVAPEDQSQSQQSEPSDPSEPVAPPTFLPDDEIVACSMDAKICPDGTGVGRVPPSCAFAPCPGE